MRSNCGWVVLSVLILACGGNNTTHPGGGSSGAAGNQGVAGNGGEPDGNGSGGSGSLPAGGKAATGGTTGVLGTIEAFPSAYGAAICQLIKRCWQTYTGAQGESCETALERQLREGSFSNLAAAVEDGRVEYQPEAAGACLNATATASCEQALSIEPADCDAVFVGSLKEGEACTLDAECEGEQQCVADGACPGTCGPLLAEGEPCGALNSCARGLLCPTSGLEPLCTVPAKLGEECSASKPCSSFQLCLGLDRQDPESTGQCAPRDELFGAALGEACSIGGPEGLCDPELVCVFGGSSSGAAGGTCAARVTAGEACQLALPDQCPTGQFCLVAADADTASFAGTCTLNPKLGERCRYSLTPGGVPTLLAPCPAGHLCSSVTLSCERGKSLGEVCANDDECYSTYCRGGECAAALECE